LFPDVAGKFLARVIKQETKTPGRETHEKTYRIRVKHLQESNALGKLRIRNIRTDDIRNYIDERRLGKPKQNNLHGARTSDKTISHELTALRRVFRYAEDDGQINRDVVPRFPQLVVIRVHRLWLSPDQQKQILQEQMKQIKACDQSNNLNEYNKWGRWQLYDAMLFILHSGLRPSELYEMKYSDIEWDTLVNKGNELDRGFLKLRRSKTMRHRPRKNVQFNYGGVRALMRCKERKYLGRDYMGSKPKVLERMGTKNQLPGPTDYVFPSDIGYALSDLLEKLNMREEMQYGNKTFRSLYSFRHSYISNQLREGVEPWVIAENCGTSFHQLQTHYIASMGAEWYGHKLQEGKVKQLTKQRLAKEKERMSKLKHGKEYKTYEKLEKQLAKMKKKLGITA
jgi:integrase